jgi:hypothetical protein
VSFLGSWWCASCAPTRPVARNMYQARLGWKPPVLQTTR